MRKLPALQFYPGDWRGSYWIKVDPLRLWELPAEPACYVIYLDRKLSYIGQTRNLRKRFSEYAIRHAYSTGIITPWGYIRSLRVKCRFSTRYGDWAMRELRLIRRLQPPMNCAGSTRKRAQAGT